MGSAYADSIGDIVESTGVGGIIRNNETLPNDVGSDINLYDEARNSKWSYVDRVLRRRRTCID